MNILFVHQNMPGQFRHLAAHLARDPQNRVAFITRRTDRDIQGVLRASYSLRLPPSPKTRRLGEDLVRQSMFGEAALRACQALLAKGFRPDVIVGHPGWGELLFLKELLPDVSLIAYCEFFYDRAAPFFQRDPPAPLRLGERLQRQAQSAHLLLSLAAADRGWSPTQWQKSLHPPEFQPKIDVCFDGVDTDRIAPRAGAAFSLPDGRTLSQEDEVITYAARSLEPCRGFPSFMRALPELMKLRPRAQVVIAGDNAPHYDAPPEDAATWRDALLREVALDLSRVHFVGRLPHQRFVQMLQVSSLHVYLTSPIVLSWSLFEAMSCGCLIVGSDTPPVREVISDGHNGFLTSFYEPSVIALDICSALARSDRREIMRNARQKVIERFSLAGCLEVQERMVQAK